MNPRIKTTYTDEDDYVVEFLGGSASPRMVPVPHDETPPVWDDDIPVNLAGEGDDA